MKVVGHNEVQGDELDRLCWLQEDLASDCVVFNVRLCRRRRIDDDAESLETSKGLDSLESWRDCRSEAGEGRFTVWLEDDRLCNLTNLAADVDEEAADVDTVER